MKHIQIAILIFMSHPAFAQSFDYRSYNQLVNKAELEITDNKFLEAFGNYNSAFRIKDKPFVQDLYNASICAVKANKVTEAMNLCKKLADAGVGGKFLNRKSIYAPLKKLDSWDEIVRQADSKRAKFQSENRDLLHLLDSMAAKDQRLNQEWRAAGLTMETPERKQMDLTYDTLSQDLYNLFNSIGFISEQMIGAVVKDDTTLEYWLPANIIVVHNYQSRRVGDTLFRPILYKAIEQGLIKPEYVAHIEDFGSNNIGRPDYGTAHSYMLYKCNVYLDHYAKESFPAADENRKQIGMGPVADDLKKILFKISNPENEFMIRANYSKIGSFANTDSEEKFLQTSELIVKDIPDCNE